MTPRQLILITFAGLALAVAVLAGAVGWRMDEAADGATPEQIRSLLLTYGSGGVLALIALLALAWAVLDRYLAGSLLTLVRNIQLVTHANPDHDIDFGPHHFLGELPRAVGTMARELAMARHQVDRTVASVIMGMEEQKGWLEAILRDLHEGVIVCNLNHEILLYNHRSLELLHVAGELGLGRPLFSVMNRQPFLHAVEHLTDRLSENGRDVHPRGLMTPFMATTPDGQYTFEGQMSLILDRDGKVTGYVITFEDNTRELAALGKRDHLLSEATEGLRQPVASLLAAAETLEAHPEMDDEQQAAFDKVIAHESKRLSDRLRDLTAESRGLIGGAWPMADVYSANLLNGVVRRLRQDKDIGAVMTGLPQWLYGDTYTMVELLDHIIHRVHEHTGVRAFDLEASLGDSRVYLDVIWEGPVIQAAVLDSWLDRTLAGAWGELTARDVLKHHNTELWSQPHRENFSRLRLPLPPAVRDRARGGHSALPSRPEFYDFDLFNRPPYPEQLGRQRLKSLNFVVFDTETTGLKPSEGDEIISIAGVRMVNGRILTGESFSSLVHPGREIPDKSARFHRITEEMVKDKPPITKVLVQFKEFVSDSVLVAHNAAFDMKFLQLKEKASGIVFDNPVLDTLLLSAFLHDQDDRHSLEAIAERFGVKIEGRHTALGDSLVTAGVFLRMMD
ncbi:MAG: exonuclease domain-containing protein, partial [Rhodospirillales bacterium]